LRPILGWKEFNNEELKTANSNIKKLLRVMDDNLKGKKFLVGDNITIADISIAVLLVYLFRT